MGGVGCTTKESHRQLVLSSEAKKCLGHPVEQTRAQDHVCKVPAEVKRDRVDHDKAHVAVFFQQSFKLRTMWMACAGSCNA